MTVGDTVGPEVVAEWLKWERFRERCQWLPQRLNLADPVGTYQEPFANTNASVGTIEKLVSADFGLFSKTIPSRLIDFTVD